MNVAESVQVALAGLLGNKMRSFLTMLGIIIGVAAVIIVVAIGLGLKRDTLERIEKMGTNLLMVNPGPARGHGGVEGLPADRFRRRRQRVRSDMLPPQ